jgi:rhodanese-related sulfurtransferase
MNAIAPAELAQRLRSGEPALLIDVRTPAEYREVHAEGTELRPLDTLEPEMIRHRMRELHARSLYIFCRSGARAAKASALLHAAGVTEGCVVEGGTVAWEGSGLPVVRAGAETLPLERQVFVAAGSLVLLGFFMGWFVSPAFFGLSALVGGALVFSGLTGICGMAILLARMPWNSRK